jgi:hypothetical protein
MEVPMWRFLAGAAAAFLLMTGAFLLLQLRAEHSGTPQGSKPAPLTVSSWFGGGGGDPPLHAPEASEKTREEKRFSRYDKNKDGKVELDEYLAARRRNFDKLDTNHDGKLSFEEYAAKAIEKFDSAGGRKGWLTEAEFATTAPVRKASSRRCSCRTPPPQLAAAPAPAEDGSDNN